MTESRLYVYALLESAVVVPRQLRAIIDVMPVAGLFAAIERTANPPALSEDALRRQHDIVIALHRAADAIIPVRFGAVLDIDELTEVIRLRRTVLARALTRVRGHEQMTLRIFGPRAGAEPVAQVTSSGGEYLRRRAAVVRPVLGESAKRIVQAVAALTAAQSIDAGRGGVQVAIHHLIRRGAAGRYRRLAMSRARALRLVPDVVVTGPWPPFAFAPEIWLPTPVVRATRPRGRR